MSFTEREMEHYCNSTETENNIKPSLSKRCFEGKDAIIKTSPRQRARQKKPLSETRLSDLSFSVCLFVSVCLGDDKEIGRGEKKVEMK